MAKKIVFQIEVDSTGAVTSVNNLTDAVDELNDSVEGTGDELEDLGKKGKSGTKKAEGGVKSLTKSVGSFLKGLGLIGIALKVFEVLSEALQKNKKFTDGLSTATNAFQLVLGDIVETIIPPLEKGFKAIFEDPLGSIKAIGKAIKDNMITRLEGMLELIPALGKAIKLAFSGEWTKAAKVAGDASAKVALGIEGVATSIIEEGIPALSEYGKEILKTADNLTKLDNALATSAARQEALRLAALRAAEEQRQIRDDETKSIAERLAANNKLGEILEAQARAEKVIAGESLARAQAEIANGNSSIQAANELLEAKNRIAEIEERISGQRSERLINDVALRKEGVEKIFDEIDAETELTNVFETEASARLQNQIAAAEEKLIALEEAGLMENELYAQQLQEKALLEAKYTVAVNTESDKRAVKEKKNIEEVRKARLAAAAQGLAAAQQFTGAITGLANTIFANELAGAKGNAKEEEKIRKKSFYANKALQITNAVIATAAAVVASAQLGFPAAIPGIAAASALGAIQIATIAAAQYSPTGGSGGSAPRPPAIPAPELSAPQEPNITFTGGANDLNTINGGSTTSEPPTVIAQVTVSETEITGTQTTVSEYENASLLES